MPQLRSKLGRIRIAAECARLESVYRETYRGFKSLILRQNLGNPPEVTSDENSSAESFESLTIPDVPISNGYPTKIIAERARKKRPDFIAPASINEAQKALDGKPLEEVVRSAPVIQEIGLAPESTTVIKLDGDRVSNVDAMQIFGLTSETRFVWQLDRSSITLLALESGKLAFEQVLVLSRSSPAANVQITPINQIHKYLNGTK